MEEQIRGKYTPEKDIKSIMFSAWRIQGWGVRWGCHGSQSLTQLKAWNLHAVQHTLKHEGLQNAIPHGPLES